MKKSKHIISLAVTLGMGVQSMVYPLSFVSAQNTPNPTTTKERTFENSKQYTISNDYELEIAGNEAKLKKKNGVYHFKPSLYKSYNSLSGEWLTGNIADIEAQENGKPIYEMSGRTYVEDTTRIPVETDIPYDVHINMKSLPKSSYIMIGLKTYDANGNEIRERDVIRNTKTEATIQSFGEKSITVDTVDGWYQGTAEHGKMVGFYCDGDTTHLPDYTNAITRKLVDGKLKGFFDAQYASISGNTIIFERPLTPEMKKCIIPGKTKVMNHGSGATYMYPFLGNIQTGDYQTIQKTIQTEKRNNGGRTFRPETKYVSLMFLANYNNASSDYTTRFYDYTLSSTGAKPYSKWNPSIALTGSYEVGVQKITSFSDEVENGTVGYQISNDGGKTRQYRDGTTRSPVSTEKTHTQARKPLQINSASDINQHIATFDLSRKKFSRKAFLQSDGDQQTTLKKVAITTPLDTDKDGIPDETDTDDDNDGVSDDIEKKAGTDPLDPKSKPLDTDSDGTFDYEDDDDDNDGLTDTEEKEKGTSPLVADTDGDTITDKIDNCPLDSNTDQLDTDSDKLGNICDDDDDGDGVSDEDEKKAGSDPLDPKSTPTDIDGDGIPNDLDTDTDGDGVSDEDEMLAGLNSKKADTDGDGILDGDEDTDGDGKKNSDESDPLLATSRDTDKDGTPDIIDPDDNTPIVIPSIPTLPHTGAEW